jgi:hypothetical protein
MDDLCFNHHFDKKDGLNQAPDFCRPCFPHFLKVAKRAILAPFQSLQI